MLVDDLHLLDGASAMLLRQLLDARVIRLICTVRSGEATTAAVAALTNGDQAHRIDLTVFNTGQVEEVLRAGLGGPVGRRTLHELHAASGGNALYLRELVSGALAGGTLAYDGEIWELAEDTLPTTPKLSELVGARLAAADQAARPLLELLALCEPIGLGDAQVIASAAVLEALEAEGLINVATDRRRTTLTLSHPLYGEVLRSTVPALRRRELLVAQAERTRAHGARRREDALHMATWLLAATGSADPATLVQAAALARHAHEYQQVTKLLEALPEDSRTYSSCLLHGEALMQLGNEWKAADALLAEAEVRAVGEAERVEAALARSWNLFWMGAFTDEPLQVNDTARKAVTDPVSRHLLTLNEGLLRNFSGQAIQGLALLDDLEVDPRQAPHIDVWVAAAKSKTAALALLGRTTEAVEWGEHAYAAHLKIREQEIGPHPAGQLNPLLVTLADAGQLAAARETAERALAGTMNVGIALAWVWAASFRGRVEWLAGDIGEARRWHAECLARSRTYHLDRSMYYGLAGLAASAAVLGDLDAAEKALAELRRLPSMGFAAGEEDLGEAWLHAARGDLTQARKVLAAAADKAHEAGHISSEMMLLTDIARLGGAEDVVNRLADLAPSCEGAFTSARVHLAAALAADDPQQLKDAADELEAIGAYLLAAEAATAAALSWRRSGHTRRATAATNQAEACAAHCPGVRTPLLASHEATSALTNREREVALLAAVGSPSKDIATKLHLSVRTVDNHLQHAYAKLGVSTRRELAEALGVHMVQRATVDMRRMQVQ
ncbi:LuxR C-terminal-related transcriptional regulator [Streptomyces sp. 1222.5]|uniref:helix-turn-helix transcriptional regulator n=1 Tax=Streptomyces sp. 1222.5 TaxID=1881026 RepID=UPI003EC0AE1B